MNNQNLSEKLNNILKELNMNRKEFFEACKEVNPHISKPTVLNVINGKNKSCPSLETIDTIIKVCQKSNHILLKEISYNYLLNEEIINISDENIILNNKMHLTDKSIEVVSNLKKSVNTSNVLNNIIENINYNFWENLGYIESLVEIQKATDILIEHEKKNSDKKNFASIKLEYMDFKRNELEEQKRLLTKKEYRKYLIDFLDYADIFDEKDSIEELEENYFKKIDTFYLDLSNVLENFINTDGSVSNPAYSKDDLCKFLIYLKEKSSYNNEFLDAYIKYFRDINIKFAISSVDFKEYLRYNFKTQYIYLKQVNKYLKVLEKYKEEKINLDLEQYTKISAVIYKLSELLLSLNKYFRLVANEYMGDYINKL